MQGGERLLFTFLQLHRTGTAEHAWMIRYLGTTSSTDVAFIVRNLHAEPNGFCIKEGPKSSSPEEFSEDQILDTCEATISTQFWTSLTPPQTAMRTLHECHRINTVEGTSEVS